MGLVNESNLASANKSFITAVNSVFGDKPPGVWQQFTRKMPGVGTSADLLVTDGEPQIREWLGSKIFKDLRTYKLSLDLRPWEKSIKLKVDQINGDVSGVVGTTLSNFAKSGQFAYDYIVLTELLANSACYDGVALFSASHVNTGSGTSDNLGSATLSHAESKNAREAMRDMTNEASEHIDVVPNLLLVGPQNERLGMEITGSNRPVGISSAGAQDATSNVTAAIPITNYIGGSLALAVTPRFTGGQYVFLDTTKGDRQFMYAVEYQAPRADTMDSPTDHNVFHNDEVLFSLTAKMTPTPGDWHLGYGYPTA